MYTTLQQNDVGITFLITITQQDGSAQDISSATSLIIYLIRPDQTIIGNASFTTDGTDGKLQYISQTGDLSVVGMYKIQASYTISGNILNTQKTQFLVEPNL